MGFLISYKVAKRLGLKNRLVGGWMGRFIKALKGLPSFIAYGHNADTLPGPELPPPSKAIRRIGRRRK